jgi:MFS family permease
MATASALSLGAALWLFSSSRLWLFTALVLIAELAAMLQNSAVLGWMSEFLSDTERGRVGGWLNAANLGGGAMGAMLVMSAATWLPFRTVGMLLALTVLASTGVLLRFPKPVKPQFGLGQILGGTLRSVVRTSKQPQVLSGFLLFLAPASCVAAINLFAGLGRDFHSSTQLVVWTTGAGAAIATSIGSVLGGYIADRVDRGVLYMSGGILASLCALLMASTPHTQAVFTAGVLAYNCVAGLCYAAYTALSLQLVGIGNPAAATQLALFSGVSNAAIVYMTWADGQGYRLFGIRGLFLVDGLAAIGTAIPLLLFLQWRARKNYAELETIDPLLGEA